MSAFSSEPPGAEFPGDRPPIELITEADGSVPPPEFEAECRGFGIEVEPDEILQLGRFLSLLLANDARMNLTAIRDEVEGWRRHIFDALTLISVLHDLPSGARVADVGSGGGVPALPLAIALPQLRFTLVEATKKKAHFLEVMARTLGLADRVSVIPERAELAGHRPELREVHAAVIARAVGPLRVLLELTVPFVEVGGRAVLVKGARAEDELAEAKKALHSLHASHRLTVDTPTGKLVVIEKRQKTPHKYPRRPGEPKRAPL